MANVNIGSRVVYDGRVYTVVSINEEGIVIAEAPRNAWGAMPTILGDVELFQNLMTF